MAYRDMHIPFSDEELQGLRELWRSLPTFNSETRTIRSSDIPALIKGMRWERNAEQLKAYQTYIDEANPDEDVFIEVCKGKLTRAGNFGRALALGADKDKDGYISAEEFNRILAVLIVNDPRLTGKSYEVFVQEADVSGDGKVSIEECTNWIEEYAPNSRAASLEREVA